MAELFQVEKKIRMNQWDIVRFQLITHCYLSHIHLSENDLSCLALLSISGTRTLEDFCNISRSRGIFSSNQSARNALAKAEKKNLIIKEGNNKKRISINPALKIQAEGNIVFDLRIMCIQPVKILESQEN